MIRKKLKIHKMMIPVDLSGVTGFSGDMVVVTLLSGASVVRCKTSSLKFPAPAEFSALILMPYSVTGSKPSA